MRRRVWSGRSWRSSSLSSPIRRSRSLRARGEVVARAGGGAGCVVFLNQSLAGWGGIAVGGSGCSSVCAQGFRVWSCCAGRPPGLLAGGSPGLRVFGPCRVWSVGHGPSLVCGGGRQWPHQPPLRITPPAGQCQPLGSRAHRPASCLRPGGRRPGPRATTTHRMIRFTL